MATPIAPEAEAILKRLEGLGSGSAGTKVTPDAEAILRRLEAQGKRMTPPPPPPPEVVFKEPAAPRSGKYQYSPAGNVIDPVTGQEMRRGAPVTNAPQTANTLPLERGLKALQGYAFKPRSAPFDPFVAALNVAVDEGLKSEATGGPVAGFTGFFRGLITKSPRAAVKALTAPPTTPTFISEPLRAEGVNPLVAEGAQLVVSTLLTDPMAARMWGGVLGFAGKRGRQLAEGMGLLDKPIGRGGKTIRQMGADQRLRQSAKQAFVHGDALAGQIKREGEMVLREAEKVYAKYRKRGVDLARRTPDGRRVNAADELVTDWIEAGTPGAKYGTRAQAEAAAKGVGFEVSDLRQLGTRISQTYGKSGRWLEKVGLLKPGTVDRFGGRYVARLYHVSSHNPDDIEAALRVAEELGTLSPQAVQRGQQVLRRASQGGFSSVKPRKLTEFAEREGYLAERQAGVTLGAALPKQAKLGARGEALRQISENPELFSKAEVSGWIQSKVGPVEGYFHPMALQVIEDALRRPPDSKALAVLAEAARIIKTGWATYNVPVQLGNVKQNVALMEGATAARGIHWNPLQIGKEMMANLPTMLKAARGEIKDPFFEGLASRSRAFASESGMLGKAGQSLRGSIGIDTTAQRIGKGAKALANLPPTAFGKVEQLGKYSLYKKLVQQGVPEDEAAQIVDRALFDHMDVDARVAALNKYGILPFLSTRIKGAENSLAIWLKNPDILLRHSGLRLGQAGFAVASPEAQQRDELRRPGEQLPLYLPGMTGPQGRPLAATGQLFSQNPLVALNPEMNDPFAGGVLGPAREALQNFDEFKRQVTGESFIVKPGEVPALEAILARVKHAAQGTVPTLTPGVGREWQALGRAAEGVSTYGGPFAEPEPVGLVVLRALTGIRIKEAPETQREGLTRATQNLRESLPNQRYLFNYLAALRRGGVQPDRFQDWMLPGDAKTANIWAKTAMDATLKYVVGKQGKQNDPETQAKIRRLASWIVQLEQRHQELTGKGLDLDALLQGGQ